MPVFPMSRVVGVVVFACCVLCVPNVAFSQQGDVVHGNDPEVFLAPLSFWRRFRFDSALATTSVRVQENVDFEDKDIDSDSAGMPATLRLIEVSQEFAGAYQFLRRDRYQASAELSLIALGAAPASGEAALSLPLGFRFGARAGVAGTIRLGHGVRLGGRVDASALEGQDLSLNNAIASYDPSAPNAASRLYAMLVRPENQFTPGAAASIAVPAWWAELQGALRLDYFYTERKRLVGNDWVSTTDGDWSLSAAAAAGYHCRRAPLGVQIGVLTSDLLDGARRAAMGTLSVFVLPDTGRIQVSVSYAAAISTGGLVENIGVLRLVAYHH